MRFSLRHKITALFLGLILGLGAVVVGSFYLMTRGEIDRAIKRDVDSTSTLMERLMRERATYLLGQARLVADLPTFKNAVNFGNAATVAERANVFQKSLRADGVAVTDRNGMLLAGVGAAHGLGTDLSRDSAVVRALDKKEWSGVEIVGGRLMLVTTVPILVGDYAQGTLSAYAEVGAETARELKESLSTDVAFVAGSKITSSSISHLQLPSEAGQGPRQIELNGETYIVQKAPLPGARHNVDAAFFVIRNRADLVGGYDQFSLTFLCVLLVSSLAAFLAARKFAGQITQPLGGVVVAAEKLRNGEWPDRFEVARGDEIGILQSTFNEMTASLQESQRKLLAMIDCDPLTELDNHRRFKETLESETSRCVASGQPLSLVLIDLDQFGEYNECYGHTLGDQYLKTVANTILTISPAIARVARQSGDGFSVTLPMTSIDEASELADRLRCAISGLSGVTASCGCAEVGPGTAASNTLILAAEIALERAKQLGRNQVGRYDKVAGAEGGADPRELNEYLQDASLATIQALAAAVDAKDHYTRGHSQRVAEYASRLCAYVGGTPAEVELTYRTGTLHDVGKIGIPDSILNKPGRLTEDERAVIETHPVVGELIVKKVPQLSETLTGVRHHHERWDGRGYPDGLTGPETTKLARTLAIADTYDAMTSDRPYRKGLAIEIALQEIVKGAGTQFDPYLASAFAKMMWEEAGLAVAA